jgi:hypothetical protein
VGAQPLPEVRIMYIVLQGQAEQQPQSDEGFLANWARSAAIHCKICSHAWRLPCVDEFGLNPQVPTPPTPVH